MLRILLCASTAVALIAAAPVGPFVTPAQAQVAVSVSAPIAPPLLPVYVQPPIPGPGYLWVPGYWAWDGTEYYWAPGYWAQPPAVGLLWTPGYWGWNDADNAYVFNAGYWGPTVGFYGGIDYGFGYTGQGYYGGYWQGNNFYYNNAVNNFGGVAIKTAYNQTVPAASGNRVSFNGGQGGVTASPTQAQIVAAQARRDPPTAAQMQHQEAASRIASLKYGANHGQPQLAAVQRANAFEGARTGEAKPAGAAGAAGAAAAGAAGAAAMHAREATAPGARGATAPPGAHQATAAQRPGEPDGGGVNPRLAQQPPVRPQAARTAPAAHPNMRPRMAAHAPAAATRPIGRAPQAPRFASRAPAMRPHAAAPRMAFHAPARMGPIGAMRPGGMHVAATPHFGGMRPVGMPGGGGMRMGGMPHGAPGGGARPGGGGGGHRQP
jgi:hypothetical protein